MLKYTATITHQPKGVIASVREVFEYNHAYMQEKIQLLKSELLKAKTPNQVAEIQDAIKHGEVVIDDINAELKLLQDDTPIEDIIRSFNLPPFNYPHEELQNILDNLPDRLKKRNYLAV